MKFDFEKDLVFRKYPKVLTDKSQTINESKQVVFNFKKSFFSFGKLMASGYFIFCLFCLQSYFLRQNIEYKQKTFIG